MAGKRCSRQSSIYGSCRDSQSCCLTSCGNFSPTRRPTYQDNHLPKDLPTRSLPSKNLLPRSSTLKRPTYYKHLPGKYQEESFQHPCMCKRIRAHQRPCHCCLCIYWPCDLQSSQSIGNSLRHFSRPWHGQWDPCS